jgi:4'-phosphopantetheinyl transferase EntD
MTQKEYKEFEELLLKRQEEVKRSKVAARKLLTRLGIMHLLVPKGTSKKPFGPVKI